jgi:hypothetical protein
MEKNASVVGWLRGALKLRGANKQVGEAIQKGLKYEKAISPNLKKSIATEYTGALKNVYTAEQTMKHESAGMFGAKNFIENMKANIAQKFVKPVIKKGPGRPTVDPKLKKDAPKQTAGRVNKTGVTPEGGIPEPNTGTPFSKKYPLKGMAIAGAGGYVGGKFLQSGSDNEYEYPKYGSVGSSVGKLLKGVSAAIKNKYVLGAGAVGLGTGIASGAILDDGHDKSDHGRKKIAEDMSPKEKADQKYAIAKSYENEGHSRKAEEYKDKASKAYKRAYEKRAAKIGDTFTRDMLQGVAAGLAGGVAGVVSSVTVAKLLDNSKENKKLKEELLNKGK